MQHAVPWRHPVIFPSEESSSTSSNDDGNDDDDDDDGIGEACVVSGRLTLPPLPPPSSALQQSSRRSLPPFHVYLCARPDEPGRSLRSGTPPTVAAAATTAAAIAPAPAPPPYVDHHQAATRYRSLESLRSEQGVGGSLLDAYYMSLVGRNARLLAQQKAQLRRLKEERRRGYCNVIIPRAQVPVGATGVSGMELEARVQKLEGDKNALQFQVTLLQDQLQNQQHKILDLERALETKRAQLAETEEALKRELNQRSSLEAHKLDLMTEIGNLHLKQSKLERENMDLREQLRVAEITSLEFSIPPRGRPGKPGSNTSEGDRDYGLGLGNISTEPTHNRPPSGSSAIVPTSSSGSGTANVARVYKADQYQFLSLPRPGKDVGSKTTDDLDAIWVGSAVRPPSGQQQQQRAPNAVADWPPKNLPVKRPTTPTLDRTRERIVHSCSPSPSFGNADGSGAKSRQRGIRNIFSKMKKSASAATGNGNSHDDASNSSDSSLPPRSEFQRGGIRATAGPRLGWNPNSRGTLESLKPGVPEKPSRWTSEQICTWLGELGLGTYAPAARSFLQSGEAMLSATPGDLEKHLGVKNALHRKKILLARDRLRRLQSGSKSSPEEDCDVLKLDNAGVLRWLNDVGLPQYRESFTDCRVDGAVLDKITVDEATQWLKITNFLHFLGLRSGIRVLREIHYDLTQLTRTVYEDGETDKNPPHQSTPVTSVKSLAKWSNSRIIEWLRCIDLAEFADNLKGSGVHGGVFVYEDRFNAETLAAVLAIPVSKTLLRRHLSLQFASLVGKNVLQAKREAESSRHSSAGVALSPSVKIRVYKSQFGLIKKKCKFGEFEPNDSVCPPSTDGATENTDPPVGISSGFTTNNADVPETAIE